MKIKNNDAVPGELMVNDSPKSRSSAPEASPNAIMSQSAASRRMPYYA